MARGNAGLRWFVSGQRRVIESLIKVDKQGSKTARSLKAAGKAASNIAGRSFNVLGRTSRLLTSSFDRVWRVGNRVISTISRIGRAAVDTATKIAKLTAAAAAVGVGLGVGATGIVFKATEKFKLAELSLKGIIGAKKSAEVAKISTEIAAREPAQFQDLLKLFTAISVTPGLRGEFQQKNLEPFLQNLSNTIQAMLIVQPQQGITGAIIALQEAVSGNLRSLQRRFNIPLKTLKDLTGFTTQEELGANPLKVLNAVSTFFQGIVPPALLLERAQTISVQFGNITEQVERFAAKIGESGPYKEFVTILADIAIALGEFRRSAKGAEVATRLGDILSGVIEQLRLIGEFVFQGFSFDASIADNLTELLVRAFIVIKQEGSAAFVSIQSLIKSAQRHIVAFVKVMAPSWLKNTIRLFVVLAGVVGRLGSALFNAIPGSTVAEKLDAIGRRIWKFTDGVENAIDKVLMLKDKLLEIANSPFIAGVKEAARDLADMAKSLLGFGSGGGKILESKGAGKASTFLLAALLGGGIAKQTGLIDLGKAVTSGAGGAAAAAGGPATIAAAVAAVAGGALIANKIKAASDVAGPADKADAAALIAAKRVLNLFELSRINPSLTAVSEALAFEAAGGDREKFDKERGGSELARRVDELTALRDFGAANLPEAQQRFATVDAIAQQARGPEATIEQAAINLVEALENMFDPDKKLSFANVMTIAGELMNSTINGMVETFNTLKDATSSLSEALSKWVSDLLGLPDAPDPITSTIRDLMSGDAFRNFDSNDLFPNIQGSGRRTPARTEDPAFVDSFAPTEAPNTAGDFHRLAGGEMTMKIDTGVDNGSVTMSGPNEDLGGR